MFGESYISCTPTFIVRSFVQGGSGNDSVLISNIADFTITDIVANLSGEASSLVSVGSYASTLGAGNSTSSPLTFSIPSGQAVGAYGATLLVTASNFSECSTHITVSVSSSSGPDTQGPIVTLISNSPTSPNNATAIVINASATEVGVGNGTISLCQLAIDGSGVWNDMSGAYGQTTVSVTYSVGLLAVGAHNVSVRCIDSYANMGNSSTHSFVVTAAAETQGPIVTFISVYDSQVSTNVSTTANENTVGSATCTSGTISVWSSIYGTNCPNNNATACGVCTVGATSCSVTYSNAACGFDPCYGTFKQGQLNLTCSQPAFNTSSTLTLYATASDASTGGSNISLCEFSLDGGAFTSMNAAGGTYNTSVTQSANYSIGTVSPGTHNVSVRCYDSFGNIGNASNYSFNVSQIFDTQGPIVSLITSTPSNARTGESVRINATGNDTASGGSNISICQLSLDGGAFASMNVSSGAYNTSAVQNVDYVLGTLAAGTHNVSVRCNDSAGNMGNASNYSFNVRQRREIVFITSTAAYSTDEERWLNWIGNHSSGLGFNWTRDIYTIANVTNGDINMSEYRIMAMAEYPASNAAYDALVNATRNAGHYIALLGDAMDNGIPRLGAGTGGGNTANRAAVEVHIANYITTGFTVNTDYTILSSSSSINYHTAFAGTDVLAMDNNDGRLVSGIHTNLITFGPSRPDLFNANGNTFATRILDYALNNSVQG